MMRIFIADDHKLYVEALATILESQKELSLKVVGTALTGADLEQSLEHFHQKIDFLLLDLNLPDEDGLTLLPMIKSKYPKIKVIVVTMYDESKFIQESLKLGADGYIVKSSGLIELIHAIKAVKAGDTYLGQGLIIFPKEVSEGNNGRYDDSFTVKSKLTKRELEILKLISTAKSSKEIAEVLFISDQTVSVHRKNIMRKLNVNNTASLIKFAIDNNLI